MVRLNAPGLKAGLGIMAEIEVDARQLDAIRRQLVINQFVQAAGCSGEQALQFLQAAQWEFQTALSIFFQEVAISAPHNTASGVPANTPATPPLLPDALAAFAKLQTSSSASSLSAGNSFVAGGADDQPNKGSLAIPVPPHAQRQSQ